MKRTIFLLTALLLFSSSLHSQSCYNCDKRTVYVYDFKINGITAPAADHDSIMNFYNALRIKPEVGEWINFLDANRECLVGAGSFAAAYLTPERALNDPGVLELLNIITEFGPRQEPPDYYIQGDITPVPEGFMLVELRLNAASGEEAGYGLAELAYYPNGDAAKTVSDLIGYKMGSIYQKIRNFEVDKRDQGEPYAIDPTLMITRAKTDLNFGESIEIEFTLEDCDGEPLPNRKIMLSKCFLGELDKTEVVTDDGGKGTATFKAGNVAGLVGFIAEYEWKKPTDKPGQKVFEPVYFEIGRPAEIWFGSVTYTFTEKRNNQFTSSSTDFSDVRNGGYTLNETVKAGFWVRTYAVPVQGYFRSETTPLKIQYNASSNDHGSWQSNWASSCCFIKSNTNTSIFGSSQDNSNTILDIRIDPENFSFKLEDIVSQQTGGSTEIEETFDPINKLQTNTYNTQADPESEFRFTTHGYTMDTTYTQSETNEIDPYTTEHVITSVAQKCKYLPGVTFNMTQDKRFTQDTKMENPQLGVEIDLWEQSFNTRVDMTFYKLVDADEDFSVPADYFLGQNYPNPFNPTTTINYSIANEGWVTLSIYNMLGEELRTIVSEVKQPGYYFAEFDASGFPSGTYFYQLKSGEFIKTNKMIVLK